MEQRVILELKCLGKWNNCYITVKLLPTFPRVTFFPGWFTWVLGCTSSVHPLLLHGKIKWLHSKCIMCLHSHSPSSIFIAMPFHPRHPHNNLLFCLLWTTSSSCLSLRSIIFTSSVLSSWSQAQLSSRTMLRELIRWENTCFSGYCCVSQVILWWESSTVSKYNFKKILCRSFV